MTAQIPVTEAAFQQRVIDYAMLRHWRVSHARTTATVEKGHVHYITPYQGHTGLPDLVLARNGVILLAELKSEKGKPTPEQLAWLAAAGDKGFLWKPSDWPAILAVLR